MIITPCILSCMVLKGLADSQIFLTQLLSERKCPPFYSLLWVKLKVEVHCEWGYYIRKSCGSGDISWEGDVRPLEYPTAFCVPESLCLGRESRSDRTGRSESGMKHCQGPGRSF